MINEKHSPNQDLIHIISTKQIQCSLHASTVKLISMDYFYQQPMANVYARKFYIYNSKMVYFK